MNLPSAILAHGWIPFVVIVVLTLIFSRIYINFYKSKYDSDALTSLTSGLALSIAMITTLLVPVDVFLVSFMKNSNGTFEDWAADPSLREYIENWVLYTYYAFYATMAVFIFVILPFVYFYYEEKDEIATVSTKICGALKYSVAFLLVAAVLLIAGSFVPLKAPPIENSTEWEKFEFLVKELGNNRGEDAVSFVLSVLTVIGLVIFIFLTGFGMSALPCGMIKGSRGINYDMEEIRDRRAVYAQRIAAIKEKYSGSHEMSSSDRNRLYELEEKVRLLDRRDRHLNAVRQSWAQKFMTAFRPFEMIGGVALTILGLTIFVSLLITNIDKAMNSLGPKMGYALPTRKLPNPIDIVIVYAEAVFPLDYIFFAGIALFFLFCTMSALRRVGIWFFWIRMYRIRPGRTRPQGLLMLCMTLMFIILAINIIIYALMPQYMMFGSQQFWGNKTESAVEVVELMPCSTFAPPDQCTMSRISMLLTRYCYKAWIFGATYYWCSWAFLAVIVIGSLVSIFRRRPSKIDGMVEEDDFDESDEELLVI